MDYLTIAAVHFYPYRLPLGKPLPSFSDTGREGVILQVVSREGFIGFGDAAPLPGLSKEVLKKVFHQCKKLGEECTGWQVPRKPADLCLFLKKSLPRDLLVPSVLFAFEAAVFDMLSSAEGRTVAELISPHPPAAVASAFLINGDIREVRASAAAAVEDGYRVFKLKVGGKNIPLDVQKVETLREVLPGDARIRLDANARWTLEEACSFAFAAGKDRIAFIEEPCRSEKKYEAFFRRTDIPWALEACRFGNTLNEWEGMMGFKALVIKPTIRHGFVGTLELLRQADVMGIEAIISSSFESGIGLLVLANLATLTKTVAGLGTARWFSGDLVTEPVPGKGGIIAPDRLKVSSSRFSKALMALLQA